MSGHRKYWLMVVIILFTVCFITIPRLDWDGLWYDEVYSVMNAGGVHYGPLSPVGIWHQVIAEDPYQAVGYPNVLAVWGILVGWTELATRYSSLLFALLAIAVTYRLGKTVASPSVGIVAALILGISTFFIHYAHELRAFTLVAFFSALLLLCYIRLLQSTKFELRWARIGYVVAGVGILYTHYFGAMLLIGLGIYHLLFVRKSRVWWRIVGLNIIVTVLFVPQLVAFLQGLQSYDPENVAGTALNYRGVIAHFIYYIGNNAPVLVALGLIGGVWAAKENKNARMIVGVTLFSLIALLVANEVLQIIEPSRLRYVVFLFPVFAVWIATGLVYCGNWLAKRLQPQYPSLAAIVVIVLPIIWFANGLYANYLPEFTDSIEGTYSPRLRTINNVLQQEGTAEDLLAFYNGTSQQAWYMRIPLDYGMSGVPMPTMMTSALFDTDADNREWAREQIAQAERIWYAVNRTIPINDIYETFLLYLEGDYSLCRTYLYTTELSLQLYTREPAHCPDAQPLLTFGEDFTLTGYQQEWHDTTLTLYLGWDIAESIPPDTYSLALHITEHDKSDEVAAQADIAFEAQSFASMRVDIDVSHLTSAQYHIWLTVYNWQTGERLQGVDFRTGREGERLPVKSFFWFASANSRRSASL